MKKLLRWSVALFCLQANFASAQLFSGHDIRISNTGACSINIGVDGSYKLPESFHCEVLDKEALREVEFSLLSMSFEKGSFDGISYYLPNSWRATEDTGMVFIGVRAKPRPGTVHAKYNLSFSLEVEPVYPLNTLQLEQFSEFGRALTPEGINYLSPTDNEVLLSSKAFLYFQDGISSSYEDGSEFDPKVSEIPDFLNDNSTITRLTSAPDCEGALLVDETAPVLFQSKLWEDTDEVEFSLDINKLFFFPKRNGFPNYPEGVDKFLIYEEESLHHFTRATCRGQENTSGDIYRICSSILSQIALENHGEFSC